MIYTSLIIVKIRAEALIIKSEKKVKIPAKIGNPLSYYW